MTYDLKQEGLFKYIETKGGEQNVLLLHGLFGELSNFDAILKEIGSSHNVIVPILPMMEMPIIHVSLSGLVDHITAFIKYKGLEDLHVMGNSLGGHLSLLFALANPELIKSITLTGSSGLFETGMGSTFPRRGDYDYIKVKVQETFYDPVIATKELVDEVFNTVNDRNKAIRIIKTARSAIKHNLADKLHQIKVPTLLIWGIQDSITPPFVGEKFNELIQDTELHFMDKCGHAPMMEKPDEFNRIYNAFLDKHK